MVFLGLPPPSSVRWPSVLHASSDQDRDPLRHSRALSFLSWRCTYTLLRSTAENKRIDKSTAKGYVLSKCYRFALCDLKFWFFTARSSAGTVFGNLASLWPRNRFRDSLIGIVNIVRARFWVSIFVLIFPTHVTQIAPKTTDKWSTSWFSRVHRSLF